MSKIWLLIVLSVNTLLGMELGFEEPLEDRSTSSVVEAYIAQKKIDSFLKNGWQDGEILGEGAYADVVLALDHKGNKVAVKKIRVIEFDEHVEPVILSLLEHVNVISLSFFALDKGDHNLNLYLVIPFMQSDLKNYLYSQPRASLNKIKLMIAQLCSAVSYIHSNGVVHCDMKPENVLVDVNGDLILSDFGIARKISPSSHNHCISVLDFSSPEVLASYSLNFLDNISKTDVWSLGCIILEIVSWKKNENNSLFSEDSRAEMISSVSQLFNEGVSSLDPKESRSVVDGDSMENSSLFEVFKPKSRKASASVLCKFLGHKSLLFCTYPGEFSDLIKMLQGLLVLYPSDRATACSVFDNRFMNGVSFVSGSEISKDSHQKLMDLISRAPKNQLELVGCLSEIDKNTTII